METYEKYDDKVGRLTWKETLGENRFGNHNMHAFYGPWKLQCLIFERVDGWSFTVRYFLADGRYLQWSAAQNEYWLNWWHVRKPCLTAAEQFDGLLNLIRTPV